MPRKSERQKRVEVLTKIQKMMKPLQGLPEFVSFMDEVRQEREAVISDLCNDAVVGNEALMRCAIGELRTYNNILSLYESRVENQETERKLDTFTPENQA